MAASNDFLHIRVFKKGDAPYLTSVVTIAPPSLSAPAPDEGEAAFEERRAEFARIIGKRTELLRRFSQTTPLIPDLLMVPPPSFGVAEFSQALPDGSGDVTITRERLCTIAADLAAGIGGFHAAGECHLAILPKTLRHEGERTYLCGIGADLRGLAPRNHVLTDLGDPGFFPPEMFDKSMESKVGPWSDVYQMSATLFRLAVGTAPPSFPERLRDPPGTLARISEALDASDLLSDGGLAKAIAAGLNLSRANRPQDANEWAKELDDVRPARVANSANRGDRGFDMGEPMVLQSSTEDIARRSPGDPPERRSDRQRGGGRGMLLVVLALVVIAASAAMVALWTGEFDAPEDVALVEPAVESPPQDPEPTPTPEPTPPPPDLPEVGWLLGTWVVNQDQTGCLNRLKIDEGEEDRTLRFANPGIDKQQIDTFTQDEPDSLTTSAWTYKREGALVRMIGVGNNEGLTATLSKCVVPIEEEAAG